MNCDQTSISRYQTVIKRLNQRTKANSPKKSWAGAEEVARSVNSMWAQGQMRVWPQDLRKSQMCKYTRCNSHIGRKKQKDPQDLLTSQPTQIIKFQVLGRDLISKYKTDRSQETLGSTDKRPHKCPHSWKHSHVYHTCTHNTKLRSLHSLVLKYIKNL